MLLYYIPLPRYKNYRPFYQSMDFFVENNKTSIYTMTVTKI